jgi:hypothetical protein
MAKKRISKADQRIEHDAAARKVWEKLQAQLIALITEEDLNEILKNCPNQGQPGRGYYSNFRFFINERIIPGGAEYDEWKLYIKIIEKLTQIGIFEEQKSLQLKSELQRKIDCD